MISIQKNDLCQIVRESYIRSISESKNYDREIVAHILGLKDMLMKRNYICNIQYVPPDPNKRHRDFGYCNIRIDTTTGRGKSMNSRAMGSMISRLCEKMGLNKYFSIMEHGYDGKYCDCGLKLKPKYVVKYMNMQQMA